VFYHKIIKSAYHGELTIDFHYWAALLLTNRRSSKSKIVIYPSLFILTANLFYSFALVAPRHLNSSQVNCFFSKYFPAKIRENNDEIWKKNYSIRLCCDLEYSQLKVCNLKQYCSSLLAWGGELTKTDKRCSHNHAHTGLWSLITISSSRAWSVNKRYLLIHARIFELTDLTLEFRHSWYFFESSRIPVVYRICVEYGLNSCTCFKSRKMLMSGAQLMGGEMQIS